MPKKMAFLLCVTSADIGLMTIFNMIALVPMAKEALAALNDYEKRKKLQ